MAKKTYSYDPSKLGEQGVDLMRFQLGDTMIEGNADTCALCDEEYQACLDMHKDSWMLAKLACLESIYRRFSYEVDVKDGSVSMSLSQRVAAWKKMYDELKEEAKVAEIDPAAIDLQTEPPEPPYFYSGMMSHEDVEMRGGGRP